MKILLINGSPKKKGSVSAHFLKLLSVCLRGNLLRESVRTKADHQRVLAQLADTDAVVFALPLYIDGLPSHMLSFLQEMEQFCRDSKKTCLVYVVSNGGFIEGNQNRVLMDIFENVCHRAGLTWGGGLGIGGGVMLNVCSILFWVNIGMTLVNMLLNGVIEGNWLPVDVLYTFMINMLTLLFFHVGVLIYGLRLARAVNQGSVCGVHYTRVMLPSFLFIPVADIFFLLNAHFHGTMPWKLFEKN